MLKNTNFALKYLPLIILKAPAILFSFLILNVKVKYLKSWLTSSLCQVTERTVLIFTESRYIALFALSSFYLQKHCLLSFAKLQPLVEKSTGELKKIIQHFFCQLQILVLLSLLLSFMQLQKIMHI